MNYRCRFATGAATKPIVLGLLMVAGIVAFMMAGRPQRPDEANRAFGPGGLSIVRPHGWSVRSIDSSGNSVFVNGMSVQPDQWVGIMPTIEVQTFASTPPAELIAGWYTITFQGQSALSEKLEHNKFITRLVVTQRGGKWFQLNLTSPDLSADPMDQDLWKFVETFRYDPSAAERPTEPQPPMLESPAPDSTMPVSQGS
jgi:hypothetical protein